MGEGRKGKMHFYYSHKHSFVTSNNEKLFKGGSIKNIYTVTPRVHRSIIRMYVARQREILEIISQERRFRRDIYQSFARDRGKS